MSNQTEEQNVAPDSRVDRPKGIIYPAGIQGVLRDLLVALQDYEHAPDSKNANFWLVTKWNRFRESVLDFKGEES